MQFDEHRNDCNETQPSAGDGDYNEIVMLFEMLVERPGNKFIQAKLECALQVRDEAWKRLLLAELDGDIDEAGVACDLKPLDDDAELPF